MDSVSTSSEFEKIRRYGTRHEAFPGKTVFCFGSADSLDDPKGDWMLRLVSAATQHGIKVELHNGRIYLTW